jgi:hypothetical protein
VEKVFDAAFIAMNPNPLSMSRRAIVPVGITVSSDARVCLRQSQALSDR